MSNSDKLPIVKGDNSPPEVIIKNKSAKRTKE